MANRGRARNNAIQYHDCSTTNIFVDVRKIGLELWQGTQMVELNMLANGEAFSHEGAFVRQFD